MKKIPGFEDYSISENGEIFSRRSNKFLSPYTNKLGYRVVSLINEFGIKRKSVNRLVLMAYIGDMPSSIHAAHLDGNPANNCLSNLKWCTPKENASHRLIHGTDFRGEKSTNAKMTNESVIWLRQNYKEFGRKSNIKDLSEILGINIQNARNIAKGHGWSHIKEAITPPKYHMSKEDIIYIRKNYRCENRKSNAADLAKKFNVTKCSIFYVVSGRIGKGAKFESATEIL